MPVTKTKEVTGKRSGVTLKTRERNRYVYQAYGQTFVLPDYSHNTIQQTPAMEASGISCPTRYVWFKHKKGLKIRPEHFVEYIPYPDDYTGQEKYSDEKGRKWNQMLLGEMEIQA